MIKYRFPEERSFLLCYAEKLGFDDVVDIIHRGCVQNAMEAKTLAIFFWRMVDQVVQDDPGGIVVSGVAVKGVDLTENLLNTISIYLTNAGYGQEWNAATDAA